MVRVVWWVRNLWQHVEKELTGRGQLGTGKCSVWDQVENGASFRVFTDAIFGVDFGSLQPRFSVLLPSCHDTSGFSAFLSAPIFSILGSLAAPFSVFLPTVLCLIFRSDMSPFFAIEAPSFLSCFLEQWIHRFPIVFDISQLDRRGVFLSEGCPAV